MVDAQAVWLMFVLAVLVLCVDSCGRNRIRLSLYAVGSSVSWKVKVPEPWVRRRGLACNARLRLSTKLTFSSKKVENQVKLRSTLTQDQLRRQQDALSDNETCSSGQLLSLFSLILLVPVKRVIVISMCWFDVPARLVT